jgi:hypothetical protein
MASKEKKSKTEKVNFKIGAGNFISSTFFLWVFQLIVLLRRVGDINNLQLTLRKADTSDYNDQILDVKWTQEKLRAKNKNVKPSINRAIFSAFGWTFIRNGMLKVLWGIALWFGAYWLLKQTIALVRDITGPQSTNVTLFNV